MIVSGILVHWLLKNTEFFLSKQLPNQILSSLIHLILHIQIISLKVWQSPLDVNSKEKDRKQQPRDMNQEDLLPSLLTDKNVGQRDKDPLFETNSNHQPEKKGLLTTEPKQKINLKKKKKITLKD